MLSEKKGKKPRKVGYLKMKIIEDLKKETINNVVEKLVAKESSVDTDGSTSYVEISDYVSEHHTEVIPPKKVGQALPWVHIAISNAKRQLLNTFHSVNPEFLQSYLDEFCYKFNRRYFAEALFNRLLTTAVTYKNEFRYV
jgi:hypothetical protein